MKKKDKVLMHACCGPCSVYCIEVLENLGLSFDMFWYNPNIHPYTEYKNRLECLEEFVTKKNIHLIKEDVYNLECFLKLQLLDLKNKCSRVCYNLRLKETAKKAKELGYSKYTTTLLVSPYQDTEKLIKIGKEYGKEYDVEFIYPNFKEGFREGQKKAREMGMYMQKYCGCIFSEEERYKKG